MWAPTAHAKLASLWLAANEPATIQSAADFIDIVLATHPHSLGREISAGLRIANVGCLEVLYRVENLDRLVKIHAVRLADA